MMREPSKRPRRIPLTSEEVSNFIAYRKQLELIRLGKFKRTLTFKLLNIFNIACTFIYMELLFCYFGPCHYQKHYSYKTITNFGTGVLKDGKATVVDVEVFGVDGTVYKFIVNDFITIPGKNIMFFTAKDFLLQKDLKGLFDYPGKSYRLFSASPILFLCMLISLVSFFVFYFNLNENVYSLSGITALNAFTLFGISMI
jgi:hypothetical protein